MGDGKEWWRDKMGKDGDGDGEGTGMGMGTIWRWNGNGMGIWWGRRTAKNGEKRFHGLKLVLKEDKSCFLHK